MTDLRPANGSYQLLMLLLCISPWWPSPSSAS
jgi:hypothetical protein